MKEDCGYDLGRDMSNHNWSEWKPDETAPIMHYRICQNSGCSQPEREKHDGNANCVTSATCSKCLTNYKDTNNHIGPNMITCGRISDTEHQWTITYKGCGHTDDGPSEAHTETTPATCTAKAYCDVCKEYYGSTDPNAHNLVQHDAKAPTCTAIGWDAYQTCSRCDYTTYAEKSALGHALVNHAAKAPTCTEIGWDAYQTCSRCDYSTYVEKSALGHALVNHAAKAPTCTEIGWSAYDTCSRCDYTTYNEKSALGHALVNHVAKAPTCTTIGWDVYDTCSRCDYSTYAELAALGHDYAAKTTRPSCTERGYTTHACTRCADSYRDAYVSALGHRYGEWIPNADGTNASACLRDCGDVRTADCATLGYALAAGDGRVELTLCPVCGEVSEIRLLDAEGKLVETLDGAVLLLIEDATAEAVTGTLPGGALVVRMGALESGDTLLSVAFESDGKLTRPSGQVNISLPAELLDGHTLALIGEDGTETPLDFEVEEDIASFTLDFSDSLTPACLIRLVPEA